MELGFKLRYNGFLLLMVVIPCKVSTNTELVNTDPLLMREIQVRSLLLSPSASDVCGG